MHCEKKGTTAATDPAHKGQNHSTFLFYVSFSVFMTEDDGNRLHEAVFDTWEQDFI